MSTTALSQKQLAAVGLQIASLASNAESMLIECIEAGGDPGAMVYAETAKHLVQQIGCLADFLNQQNGEPGRVGGVAEWLLPPLYQEGQADALRA